MKVPHAGWIPVLVSVILAVGCGGKRIPVHYYTLGYHDPATTSAGSAKDLDVGVKAFHVEPPYGRDRIVYRIGEDSAEVQFYAYHRWAASLSRMLPGVAASVLAETPGVRSMEPVVPGSDYEAYLSGRVLAMEEIDLPEGQQVRVAISLTLRLEDGTEIWSDVLSGRSSLQTDDVGDIVAAMQTVLRGLLEQTRPAIASAVDGL